VPPWKKSAHLAEFNLPQAGEISVRALRRAALKNEGAQPTTVFLLANVTRHARSADAHAAA
jgi:hypothetical protein